MSDQKQDSTYGTKAFYEKRVPEHFSRFHEHLDNNPFVLFFLAKKNAGKGTYSKILNKVSDGKVVHLGVGDLVRAAEKRALDENERQSLIDDLKVYYKGEIPIEEVVEKFVEEAGDLSALLPTEMVMALIEKEVEYNKNKAIIIDGFPRSLDQINIANRMQDDFEAKGKPSAFVEIDCPDDVLLQRQMYRVTCPECQTPRNTKVLATENVGYDQGEEEFYLVCDNDTCDNIRMKPKYGKVGGEYTIETFKKDQQQTKDLLQKVHEDHPHRHIRVHNHISVSEVGNHDEADFTLETDYEFDSETKQVTKRFKPWVIKDDDGIDVLSRWPDPVVADLMKELTEWLDKSLENK